MMGLPTSLAIALWIVGSTWLIAGLAYAIDAPAEVVWATFIFGLFAGVAEWLARTVKR